MEPISAYTELKNASFTNLEVAGIYFHARTSLIFADGNLNAERYVAEIFKPVIKTFISVIGRSFLLMHDNARSHEANIRVELLVCKRHSSILKASNIARLESDQVSVGRFETVY